MMKPGRRQFDQLSVDELLLARSVRELLELGERHERCRAHRHLGCCPIVLWVGLRWFGLHFFTFSCIYDASFMCVGGGGGGMDLLGSTQPTWVTVLQIEDASGNPVEFSGNIGAVATSGGAKKRIAFRPVD